MSVDSTPVLVGLRELLEIAERQAAELCGLREAEACTSAVLTALRDSLPVALLPAQGLHQVVQEQLGNWLTPLFNVVRYELGQLNCLTPLFYMEII